MANRRFGQPIKPDITGKFPESGGIENLGKLCRSCKPRFRDNMEKDADNAIPITSAKAVMRLKPCRETPTIRVPPHTRSSTSTQSCPLPPVGGAKVREPALL